MKNIHPIFLVAIVLAVPSSCSTLRDELARGQDALYRDQDPMALAILRNVEPDIANLSVGDRARYCYLRGLTDLRVGFRVEARHWLALSAETEKDARGALPPEWNTELQSVLGGLNDEVYSTGLLSLARSSAGVDGGSPSMSSAADAGVMFPALDTSVEAGAAPSQGRD